MQGRAVADGAGGAADGSRAAAQRSTRLKAASAMVRCSTTSQTREGDMTWSVERRGFLGGGLAVGALAATTGAAAEALNPHRITLHVLDVYSGKPAANVRVDLSMLDGETYRPVKTVRTTVSGRPDGPCPERRRLQGRRIRTHVPRGRLLLRPRRQVAQPPVPEQGSGSFRRLRTGRLSYSAATHAVELFDLSRELTFPALCGRTNAIAPAAGRRA